MGPTPSAPCTLNLVPPVIHGSAELPQSPLKHFFFSLLLPRNSTVLNSKVISVTVKPFPRSLLTPLEIEFSHLYNVSFLGTCTIPQLCWLLHSRNVLVQGRGWFCRAPETSLPLQDPSISFNTGLMRHFATLGLGWCWCPVFGR